MSRVVDGYGDGHFETRVVLSAISTRSNFSDSLEHSDLQSSHAEGITKEIHSLGHRD